MCPYSFNGFPFIFNTVQVGKICHVFKINRLSSPFLKVGITDHVDPSGSCNAA